MRAPGRERAAPEDGRSRYRLCEDARAADHEEPESCMPHVSHDRLSDRFFQRISPGPYFDLGRRAEYRERIRDLEAAFPEAEGGSGPPAARAVRSELSGGLDRAPS